MWRHVPTYAGELSDFGLFWPPVIPGSASADALKNDCKTNKATPRMATDGCG